MNSSSVRRPSSLQEVAAESRTLEDFGYHLKDFLHEFAFAKERQLPLSPLLAAEPRRLAGSFREGVICDAFLAATADYLSRTNRLPTPAWALRDDLRLEEPWFSPAFPAVRLMLCRDTPSAFKDKNIFVFESALHVA